MTQRTEAKLAGYAYLAYIVFAMLAAALSGKTTAGADTSHMLSNLRSTIIIAWITVLLDLLQTVCAVVLLCFRIEVPLSFSASISASGQSVHSMTAGLSLS